MTMIGQGFPGQRLRVMPRPAVRAALVRPGPAALAVTDAGWYPRAVSHGMSRSDGVAELIVIVCSAGRGWCRIGGVEHSVRAGQVLVIPPGAAHSYHADDADPWTIWWLHLAGLELARFAESAGMTRSAPVRSPADLFRIVDLVREVLDVLERDLTMPNVLAAGAAGWHLLTLLAADRTDIGSAAGPGRPQAAAIEAARDYLRRHLDEQISVAALADRAALSPSHFAALFRRQVGMPVLRYLTGLRMARARELLDTTDLTIGEIASRTGYRDPFYFSRQFRAVHQTAPMSYRQVHKG